MLMGVYYSSSSQLVQHESAIMAPFVVAHDFGLLFEGQIRIEPFR